MYFVEKNETLTPNKIGKIINAFRTQELPKLEMYRNNYLGKQEILQKKVNDDTKPCNKIITNYLHQIVETYAGYMTGIDITYTSDEDIEAIQDVLNYNDVSSEDTELLKNALIYGTAYEVQ
jgi:SPP1 family phage portal protein